MTTETITFIHFVFIRNWNHNFSRADDVIAITSSQLRDEVREGEGKKQSHTCPEMLHPVTNNLPSLRAKRV
jgi:hypothetical protein